MHSLYRTVVGASLYVCPLSCKVDDGDSIVSVDTCSLSGSFSYSYCYNTCKPISLGAK